MGIDYGFGQTNIDHENKIRYGVISMYDVMQAWSDSSEPYYPCEDCEFEMGDDDCSEAICEPVGFYYDEEGYKISQCLDTDLMITKSPFFTAGNYCSPCVPGAINLNDRNDEIAKNDGIAYCLGHDWFEGEKAPYRVFSVETGKEVLP